MNRRTVFAALLMIALLVAVPMFISLLFTHQNAGKICVEKEIDAPYLEHVSKDVFLVFYGYVGCTKVCTPMLHRLNAFYSSRAFDPYRNEVGFVFVNLMPEIQPDQPEKFAHFFNPAFEGIYLESRELMEIDRTLGVYFSKSLNDPLELDHSDYIYLIRKDKGGRLVLLNIYMTHPLNQKLVLDDLHEYMGMK